MTNLPSFLCVGAQKAGTTWLYEVLNEHPDIWMPPIKELHFFNFVTSEDPPGWIQGHTSKALKRELRQHRTQGRPFGPAYDTYLESLNKDDVLTPDWYRRVFSFSAAHGKATGEITPAYLELPESGIEYLKSFLPECKIIILVRDPVDRAISQMKMSIKRHDMIPETKDDWAYYLQHLKKNLRGDYCRSIPRWQKFFSPEKIAIFPFSQIIADPNRLTSDIESFLGISHFDNYQSLKKRIHKSKEFVEIPQWIHEALKSDLSEQYQYLQETFGPDFLTGVPTSL